tara:strand:- start:7877 stop:8746 length:870 start_codon:yes stop_codon:yes gene_type:complete
MNYVLISVGKFPEYLKYTINSIMSVDSNAKIILCSDVNYTNKYKNVEFIDLASLENEKTRIIKNLKIYQNSIFESNPLWESSLLRVFYLESILSKSGINEFVHFDNDVLIYKSFDEVRKEISNSKFNITRASDKLLVFGYSYISNLKPLSIITQKIIDFCDYANHHNWKFNYGKPYNEMDFLGKIYSDDNTLFNCLPILPYDSDVIFDPSSYGQYFDGTHLHPKKIITGRHINHNHYIGTEIIAKRIKVKFIDKSPIVSWNKKSYDIANLHIHSKRLNRFLPKEYKDYV